MAALTAARPVSQILPDEFDSSSLPSSSRKPRPRSHYRPFSTLYTESPYIQIENKPAARLLKRASSVGGLHAFQTMTLGINFRPRKEKDSPTAPQVAQLGTPIRKVSPPLKFKPRPAALQDDTKRLNRSSAYNTRPDSPVPLRPPKLKRSMASIFTGSDATASPETVRPVLEHPSEPEDPPRPSTAKSVKFNLKDEEKEDSPPRTFVPLDQHTWKRDNRMKLHPYSGEASYMQAYDPVLLESDRYSDLLLQRLSDGSPSFYDYGKTPPASALDLGCGQGHWVLHAASVWKNCQITGFDLVDIRLPVFEKTENAHFVQGNFVKYQLPFPDESFEFVRMANLILCIPYHCWVDVFTEVRRVLTRTGRLEVIDDQIMFPYGTTPVPKEDGKVSLDMNDRSFDLDDYFSDEVDSDTLEGEDSEDSTLNSDQSLPTSHPSSFKEEHLAVPVSQLSASETIRPLHHHHRLPKLGPYKKPVITDPYLAQSLDTTWRQRSTTCRELESLFFSMLSDPREGYQVFPHALEFVGAFMKDAFGEDRATKTASFSVKLAEWDSPIGAGVETPDELMLEKEKEGQGYSTPWDASLQKKKPWITREKKEKKEKEKKGKGGGNGAAAAENESDIERSSLEMPAPPTLNAKAAKRLGIPTPSNVPSTPILKPTRRGKTPSPPLPTSSPAAPTQNQLKAPAVSAKVAGVLGMSYSQLAAATAQATAGRRSGRKPQGLVQSPGLLIGNSTYIALDPLELEWHACKFMHMLLGCRPALAKFVAKFVDEKGARMVDDAMFGYYMGEYEAFRRLRFGWPNDAREPYEEYLHKPVYDDYSLNDHLLHEPPSPSPPNGRYQSDEAVHIRSIRVYHAVKSGNSSFFSPPRSSTS